LTFLDAVDTARVSKMRVIGLRMDFSISTNIEELSASRSMLSFNGAGTVSPPAIDFIGIAAERRKRFLLFSRLFSRPNLGCTAASPWQL
jgi:hypothetical protein